MDAERPATHNYKFAYISSLIIALLMAVASVAGLVTDVYSTESLRLAFIPNGVANL